MASSLEAQQQRVLAGLVDEPLADALGERFAAAGHELHLVGGRVRDALLQREATRDLDFATSAPPEQTERVLRGWADAIWLIGARYGTVAARKDGLHVQITTYRSDRYTPGSRHPAVEYGDTIEGDLGRRDFTVNAMAVRVPDRLFVDPHGGLADLRRGILRTPAEPSRSFADDPLRIVRMARFASVLGFDADEDAVAAATAMAEQVLSVSAERVRDELDRLLAGDHVGRGVDLLCDTGVADHVLPEVPALRMERDPGHHHKDVYGHTLAVVAGVPADDPVLRLAALLHDVGKPATRRYHGRNLVSFHHHEVVGARIAQARLEALRYPGDVVQAVAELVRLHLRFHGYADGDWTDSAVRRYVRDAGSPEQLRRLNLLTRADVTTADAKRRARYGAAMDDLERRVARLAEQETLERLRPALDGNQIMAHLGLRPGPLVGKAWHMLLDARLERGPMGDQEAYALLDQWAATEGLAVSSSNGIER